MDRHLFLVRHAQAVIPSSGQQDFERELTPAGFFEASRMGNYLKQLGVHPALVFTSPALRALTTAQFMAEQMGYDTEKLVVEPLLYEEFALQSFVEMINRVADQHGAVMIVGHNPKQTYLSEYFTRQDLGSLPTGGVVHIAFENQRWAEVSGGTGKVVRFEYPDKLAQS